MTKPHVSLKTMAEDKALDGVSKLTIFTVDPDLVEIEPGYNLRTPGPRLDAHMERMYQAMKAGASFPPIDVIVCEGRIVVRLGHCRTLTARRLKAEGIPYLLQARHYRGDEVEQALDLIGENSGLGHTPLEDGMGYQRLRRFNMDIDAIAKRCGVTRTTVENGLLLAEAPQEIKQMITREEVACHTAIEAIRAHKDKAASVLAAALERAKQRGKTKVTPKDTAAPRIPAKAARALATHTAAIRQFIGDEETAALLETDDEQVKDRMVMVPALVIKGLLTAQGGMKKEASHG